MRKQSLKPAHWGYIMLSRTVTVTVIAVISVLAVVLGIALYPVWKMSREWPLILAAGNGDVHTVEIYLDSHPDPKSETFEHTFNSAIHGAHVPFDNYVRIIGLFIDHGEDPNQALKAAFDSQKPELVEIAVHKGADVNRHYSDGGTPLSKAAIYGNKALIKMLKAAGAKK